MNGRGVFLSLAFTSLVIGGAACSSSGGTGVATPTPTPSGSSPLSLGTQGNISCTAPNNAVPGTYASIYSEGTVTGDTYTQGSGDEAGIYTTAAYTAPVGGTPAPSPTPIVIPSVPPTTAGATLWIVYYGEYTLPTTPGITTAPTNGCFVVETASTTPGQVTPTSFNVQGFGSPQFAAPYPSQTAVIESSISAFTISNVSRTSGTGSFTINTTIAGESQSATGTAVVTGSTAFYSNETLNTGSILRRP
jgi:hypothetical protein